MSQTNDWTSWRNSAAISGLFENTRTNLLSRQAPADRLRVDPGTPYGRFQPPSRDDPAAFIHDCVDWEGGSPADYQTDIAERLISKRRVGVRAAHAVGKTTTAAIVILWFALTRDGDDWKIPCTASAWRQLSKYLWPEIHKWARRLHWSAIGRPPFDPRTELLTLTPRLATGEAFALASDEAANMEGAHADHLMYVYDEAKVVPDDTWDATEGAFAGTGEALALGRGWRPAADSGARSRPCSRTGWKASSRPLTRTV